MSEPLTFERLSLTRRLVSAATPGEWHIHFDALNMEVFSETHGLVASIERTLNEGGAADAGFIADAHKTVPRLLDEIDRLNGCIDRALAEAESAHSAAIVSQRACAEALAYLARLESGEA